MYIKIPAQKVPFGIPVLNGEPLVIKLLKVTQYNIGEIYIEFKVFNEKLTYEGNIGSITNPIIFTSNLKPNLYTAAKILKEYIESLFEITGLEILSDLTWLHLTRSIRLYIPFEEVIENSNYTLLISSMISLGVPYYKQEDGYVVYLEEIYPDHRALLESDENVFIEE